VKKGDTVTVYPHGDKSKAGRGKVIVISENQCAIAVAFGDKPPFAHLPYAIHPLWGFVLLAMRANLNGEWGPWIETGGDGHYEIEEAS
jgi:hypothetical protein